MTTPGGVAFQKHECSNPVPPAMQPNPNAASPDWKPVIERPEPTVAPATSGGQLPSGYMVVPVVMQPCGPICAKCTSQSSTSNGTTVTLYSCADPPRHQAAPGPGRAPTDPLSSTGASLPSGGPSLPESQRSNTSMGAATAEGSECNSGESYDWDHNVCVRLVGGAWIANGWPCNMVKKAWDQCDEKSCRSNKIVAYRQDNTYNCNGGGRSVVLYATFSGTYNGWADRERMIKAALRTQYYQCGNWNNEGWWIPTQITLRDYDRGAWMNMDFEGVCYDPAVVRPEGDLLESLASTLDWKDIAALKYINVV
jgi:hypothetical protein